MPTSSRWGISPRESVELECARRGADRVVDGCIALLNGARPGDGGPDDGRASDTHGSSGGGRAPDDDRGPGDDRSPEDGRSSVGDRSPGVDARLVFALGGPLAEWALEGENREREYWLRVWAARGLLYAWDERATSAVIRALADEHWRVREMAARVCAKHRIDDAVSGLAALVDDERDRVRQAADRALARITAAS